MRPRFIALLTWVVSAAGLVTHCQTLALTADLSGKLPSGSAFTAVAGNGTIYVGHIITKPACHWMRRGALQLVFDQRVTMVSVRSKAKVDSEGVTRPRHIRQALGAGIATAAALMTDDFIVDPLFTTAGSKNPALYLIDAGVGIGAWYVQKGGNIELKAGTKIEVEALR